MIENMRVVRWPSCLTIVELTVTYNNEQVVTHLTPLDARKLLAILPEAAMSDVPKNLIKAVGDKNKRFLVYYINTDEESENDDGESVDMHFFKFPTEKLMEEFLEEVGGIQNGNLTSLWTKK